MNNDDNFTKRAKDAMRNAASEAAKRHHNYVSTEHMLLGLLALGNGVAHNVLVRLGVNPEQLREAVEQHLQAGPDDVRISNPVPLTPRMQKVILLSRREAKQLGHNYIGSEHILLGLLAESDGVAAKALSARGLTLEKVRRQIRIELDPDASDAAGSIPSPEEIFGALGGGNAEPLDSSAEPGGNAEEPQMRDPIESGNRRQEKTFSRLCIIRDITTVIAS